MNAGSWVCPLFLESQIYGGSPTVLLNIAKKQSNQYQSICFVGHEPNFSWFISKATDVQHYRLPTASMVRINFDIKDWEKIQLGTGMVDWLQKPKRLID